MAEKKAKKLDLNRRAMVKQLPEERKQNFNEVALGYPVETAVEEAKRCLQCKSVFQTVRWKLISPDL